MDYGIFTLNAKPLHSGSRNLAGGWTMIESGLTSRVKVIGQILEVNKHDIPAVCTDHVYSQYD